MGRKYTTSGFISLSIKVHGSKYDYSNVEYKLSTAKVKIICPLHGEFLQVAAEHLRGKGCDVCGGTSKTTLNGFIGKANLIHGTKYDYSNSKYVNDSIKLSIRCNVCNKVFNQSPNNHLGGHGCPSCAAEESRLRQRSSTEQFKGKVVTLFGDKYDLSETEYGNNSKDKVKIKCREHGEFLILPSDLFRGNGCPSCAMFGFRDRSKGYLYVASDGCLTKVGLTNSSAEIRVKQVSKHSGLSFLVVKEYGDIPIGYCRELESRILKKLRVNYKSPKEKFNGHTECFYHVNLAELLNTIDNELNNIKEII